MHLSKLTTIGSLLLGIFSFSAFPQTAGLTGTVVDGNAAPVPGALVTLHKAGLSAYTDKKGRFAFDSLSTGILTGSRASHAASQFLIRSNVLHFVSTHDGQAVQVRLFDLSGREVALCADIRVDKGSYSIPLFNSRSGRTIHSVLILRARVGSEEFIHRICPAGINSGSVLRATVSATGGHA